MINFGFGKGLDALSYYTNNVWWLLGASEQKICSRERYQMQTFFAPDDRALRFGALKRLARGIVQRVPTDNLRKMGGGVA